MGFSKFVSGATILGLAAALVSSCAEKPKQRPLPDLPQFSESPAGSKTGSCGPVQTVGPYPQADEDATHVDLGAAPRLSTYASVPPASGPHAPAPLPAGVYDSPPDVYAIIHSLEHGAVAVWFAPTTGGPELDRVKQLVSANQDHVVMAPYDYPSEGEAGVLPAGSKMALVAWHHVQLCDGPDAATVEKFLSSYRAPPLDGGVYIGDAPEAGVSI
ncbi:MAG: DUF3105 domain-containing protein [Actinomycetota bacterium]